MPAHAPSWLSTSYSVQFLNTAFFSAGRGGFLPQFFLYRPVRICVFTAAAGSSLHLLFIPSVSNLILVRQYILGQATLVLKK
jgi:hypothetical protein